MRLLWVVIIGASIWSHCTAAEPMEGCKLAIINFNDPAFGLPPCNEDTRMVSNGGVVQNPPKDYPNGDAQGLESHKYSQAAGPYWLAEAIKASPFYTSDADSATAVLAYDYCHMSWLVAAVFGGGSHDGLDPRLIIQAGYQHLLSTARFQRYQAKDFAFFAPHPLIGPHFDQTLYCDHLRRAIHLVVEAPQRLACTNVSDSYLVVPYSSPKFAEESVGHTAEARKLTAFFTASCTDDMTYNVQDFGMKMRLHMVQRLGATPAPDIFVKCANEHRMPYEELQAHMRRSTFCLLPPGGTASSRRLTDVVLSGCIPVFIGPPWHAMPLARHLDYTTFAVFVNARSMRFLYGGRGVGKWSDLEESPFSNATSVFEPIFWFPEVNISQVAIDVEDIAELPAKLRAIPADDIQQMQSHLAQAQPSFRYRRRPVEVAQKHVRTASDIIMEEMCQRGRSAQASAAAVSAELAARLPHKHAHVKQQYQVCVAVEQQSLLQCQLNPEGRVQLALVFRAAVPAAFKYPCAGDSNEEGRCSSSVAPIIVKWISHTVTGQLLEEDLSMEIDSVEMPAGA